MSTPRSGNPLGPAGLAVAAKIRLLRRRHGLTLRALAASTANLGRPIGQDGLNKLELGARRIDVDDLVAIAAALGTTAAALLEPLEMCTACEGAPPAGFACLSCGSEAAS